MAVSTNLITTRYRTGILRSPPAAWAEEPSFEHGAITRAIRDLERAARSASLNLMPIRSDLAGLGVGDARRALAGLPAPGDYRLLIKPLRYRKAPHLSALCEFDLRRIVLSVPEPFRPFDELIYHSARRKPVPGMRFIWVAENVRFRTRREVLRFLYCHEWLHWHLREVLGRRSGAETACDRFALRNFRRRQVTDADAAAALHGCRSQRLPSLEVAA
jgi:hypothetical protein